MPTMSKIAEQKALEEYPPCINSNGFDLAESRRIGYIKGYDQAMKDVMKHAEELQFRSEYFESEWKRYIDSKGGGTVTINVKDIARHFAEWQKQQMKEALQTEYEKGRYDMREEMMKDAVEGVVHHYADDELAAVHYNDPKGTPMSIYVSSKGLSAGEKVKIIICKTE